MSDLKSVLARKEAIAQEKARLAKEEEELLIAERVLRGLASEQQRKKSVIGSIGEGVETAIKGMGLTIPSGQQGKAFEVLPEDGSPIDRTKFRAEIDKQRLDPLTDNAFSTLLSRMSSARLIQRDGNTIRRANMPSDRQSSAITSLDNNEEQRNVDRDEQQHDL